MGQERPMEVAIIGGGIIGCAAAAFAAEAGARVTLFERSEIGAGASGRNMGAVQHPFDSQLAPLYEATVGIYRELAEGDGQFQLPSEPAGVLMLTPDPTVLDTEGDAAPSGLRSDLLAPRQVQSLEPSLAGDLWAIRLATGFPIPPHAATATMARRARAAGGQIEVGAAAIPAVENGRAVGVILESVRPRAADVVLVAAGPWSPFLLDPSGRWQPIIATWGATAQLDFASPPRHVVEEARVESVNQPSEGQLSQPLHPRRGRERGHHRLDVPRVRAGPARHGTTARRTREALHANPGWRSHRGHARLRATAIPRRPAARRGDRRRARALPGRRPRPVGDLLRAGDRAAGRRCDAQQRLCPHRG